MELVGDVGHVESHFGPFGESVLVKDRCTICATHIIGLENHFGRTRWYAMVTRLKW